MNVLDIEIAIMQHIGIRQNLVVPNVHWGIANLHECDILSLSKSNYASEYEIKTSKTDLLNDKKKKHGHRHHYIKSLYFVVPKKLKEIALENIPKRAGLYVCDYADVRNWDKYGFSAGYKKKLIPSLVKEPEINPTAHKWTERERYDLARLGTLRILGLKKKIQKLKEKQYQYTTNRKMVQ